MNKYVLLKLSFLRKWNVNPTPTLPAGEGAIKVLPCGEDLGEVKIQIFIYFCETCNMTVPEYVGIPFWSYF